MSENSSFARLLSITVDPRYWKTNFFDDEFIKTAILSRSDTWEEKDFNLKSLIYDYIRLFLLTILLRALIKTASN